MENEIVFDVIFRNMDEVVRFPELKPEKQLSYATRQLIAREIELEKVRRAEAYFVKQKSVSFKTFAHVKQCSVIL